MYREYCYCYTSNIFSIFFSSFYCWHAQFPMALAKWTPWMDDSFSTEIEMPRIYIYIAHRLWHDSTSLHPSLSVCVRVWMCQENNWYFRFRSHWLKNTLGFHPSLFFYQCLSLCLDTMKIPFQFYNTPSSKLVSPPTQNAYGIMDAFLFLHRRALSLSFLLFVFVCALNWMRPKNNRASIE